MQPSAVAPGGSTGRVRVRVTGTVQGVGFRPFVYREAVALGLAGYVLNDGAGVLIEAEGGAGDLRTLCTRLSERPPPLAVVTGVHAEPIEPTGDRDGFRIVESERSREARVPVSIDVAACADCLAEVDDPDDRRYRYPFTNCTNCGPRYTIVRSVPYDRPATTMAGFPMCPACRAEYDDPADRRFHAQPNSCPGCGPRLRWCGPAGAVEAEAEAALERAVSELLAGRVVAVKGLGGYHLAADATSHDAVGLLRRRKSRDDKPFAVMVPDLPTARALCELGPDAERVLASPRRPIVIAPRRPSAGVAEEVAPGLLELGLMLAYTPLHHLLLSGVGRPLVMTSGNLSDDPIAHLDDDAEERLGPLVDGMLAHDRPIHVRCDDSVLRATAGHTQLVRRSRGYAPEPLALPGDALRAVLAVGAELKSTVSVAKDRMIVASHHVGDLEHLAAYRSFLQATAHLCELFGVEPELVVHDLHPEYLSTKYATDLELEALGVQHHHAHVASCLVDHGRRGPVLGVAFDGLGFGPDGVLWGGEFLVADLHGYERVAHLAPVAMPGGAAAVREPWRMALSWVATAGGAAAAAALGPRLCGDDRWRPVLSLLDADASPATSPRTTSAGRLFDAVSALLGIRTTVSYEGQAAIELETLAAKVPQGATLPRYPFEVAEEAGHLVLDPSSLVMAVLEEVARGTPAPVVAAGFHHSLGAGAAALAADLADARGLGTVALSGGVFQNVRLTRVMERELAARGFDVLVHRDVPPNDGGISIGQAAIGALSEP